MKPGDIISHSEMCTIESRSLQRGMNFRKLEKPSVILMSVRKGAPYADRVDNNGQILIYEGHDVPRNFSTAPKRVDQQMANDSGRLTENGKFFQAAKSYQNGSSEEFVRVYEKIKKGIWVFSGVFKLIDAWTEQDEHRKVFKFKLEVTDKVVDRESRLSRDFEDLDHNRIIPTSVKLEVWKRDKGKCVQCGSSDNLHFDHNLPYSKGGTSLMAENIQLLCARHNLQKSDRIV
jgi:hypothetical protein